jgi:hypothetical protein
MSWLAIFLICALVISTSNPSKAQDAVPIEIMSRTHLIKWGNETGTAFTLEFQGRIYLITAKHVVAGVQDTNAVLQIRAGNKWEDYQTTKTIYPQSPDVDIAIFATNETSSHPYWVETMGDASGVTLGQQLWFIGYPYGFGGNIQGHLLPFLKKGSMSAVDSTNDSAVVYYIDGFNNPGFSGGPIIFWDFKLHKYEILGVVHGYTEDTAKTLINGHQVDTQYLVNSGILVAYSMKHAMDAIKGFSESKQ